MSGLLWPTRQKTPHPSPFAGSNSHKSILLGVTPVSNYWHCLKGVNLHLFSLEKKMEHSRNIKLSLIFCAWSHIIKGHTAGSSALTCHTDGLKLRQNAALLHSYCWHKIKSHCTHQPTQLVNGTTWAAPAQANPDSHLLGALSSCWNPHP